jgi:hypothetical protein
MQGDDEEPPVDLRPLRLEPGRYEALAARIEAAAAAELTRRELGSAVPQLLARAVWPALLAAAAAVVAVVGLGRTTSAASESSLAVTGIEQVVPGRTADLTWIEEQRAPTDADLVQALGLGSAE